MLSQMRAAFSLVLVLRSFRVADRLDRAGVVGRMKNMRAGDDRVSSGLDHPPCTLSAQPAVNLDDGVEAAIITQTPQRADLWQHFRKELLTAEPGIDGHDQDNPTQLQHIFDHR